MMRVAVLGGAARDLVNFRGHLISELAKAGHTVFGIAPGGTPEIREALAGLGATYVPIDTDRTGHNPVKDVLTALRLWKIFRKLKLDALLAYEIKSVVFGTLAARFAGVSKRYAMITGRGSTLQGHVESAKERLVRGLVKLMYRVALKRTHGVFFQNTDDLAFFAREGMLSDLVARTIINGSGVDLEHFARHVRPEGPLTFLFVGRLLKDKGIREYVEACRLLRERHVSARFRILGPLDTNPKAIKLEQLQAWAREGIVEYLGEAKDVRPILSQAHVLVLPSYGEGTPRSVLEGMSMGLAIVTTEAPGCRETVMDGLNGFLVPVGDAEALAEAMGRLGEDPGLIDQFGARSRQLAEQKYDVRLVSAEIMGFMGL